MQKAYCRFHYPVVDLGGIVFFCLLLKVLEVRPAEMTTEFVQVEIDIIGPGFFEGFEQIRADGASLGAARPG